MPVLDELRRRGHEVILRTLQSEVETMRSRGFDAAPIAGRIEALPMRDRRARTLAGARLGALRTIRARAPHDSRDLLETIERTRPDALIVDVLASGALSTAMSWPGPWCCYRPFPLPPSRIALEILGIGRALSAAPLHLYMTAPPFEPRGNRAANVVMVGPCQWEPPGELPTEIAEAGPPLILVTTSTEPQNDRRLVEVALEALAGEPFHVVATVPSASTAGLAVPDNATVLPFAPHTAILERAVCAITHGGMGATQKALALGVPVCAVPFGRDQFGVAQRVVDAGAGTRISSRRLRSDRLGAKVREAIACRSGAEAVRRGFAAAGGAAAAADAVERQLPA
ncbi:MAG TPA: nucleotide disphospho-sugar-binding domain-containing protein [Solirubrobacterales bacterium]|nr:nucleotide disphospho-sugar-binding domain-containing protein [Solirubrobacterales bacterium]